VIRIAFFVEKTQILLPAKRRYALYFPLDFPLLRLIRRLADPFLFDRTIDIMRFNSFSRDASIASDWRSPRATRLTYEGSTFI
jgi:hypothetical protein